LRSKWLVFGLVGGLCGVVSIALVVAMLVTPLGTLIGIGRPSDASPDASYRNGARLSWELDLAKALPEVPDVVFGFSQNLDDNFGEWERFGPRRFGDIWVAKYVPRSYESGAEEHRGLVGIDPANGKVLWHSEIPDLSLCAREELGGMLYCSTYTENSPRVVRVDLSSGRSESFVPPKGVVEGIEVAAGKVAVVTTSEQGTIMDVSLHDPSGAAAWSLTERMDEYPLGEFGLAYGEPALTVAGDFLGVRRHLGQMVLRISDGRVALRAGHGHLGPDGVYFGVSGGGQIGSGSGVQYREVHDWPTLATDGRGRTALFARGGDESALSWCEDLDPGRCRPIVRADGHGLTGNGARELHTSGSLTYAVVTDDQGRRWSVDADSGRIVGESHPVLEDSRDGGILQPGNVAVSFASGRLTFVDVLNGDFVGMGTMPGWYPTPHLPDDKLLLMELPRDKEWAFTTERIALYEPRTEPGPFGEQTLDAPGKALPEGIPSCPAGTVHLAFATFPDGWVLVCGISAGEPVYWASQYEGRQYRSHSVASYAHEGAYGAEFDDGSYQWLNRTPGVFGIAVREGAEISVQRSVGEIWFVLIDGSEGRGSSAAPPTTGPYGVALPADTAEDQVRYLADLLAASAEARASLGPATQAVAACTRGRGGYDAEVATIKSAAENRQTLLDALATAPVDRVPDGTMLVSELRTALRHSLNADNIYLEWAKAVNDYGCGAGSKAGAAEEDRKASAAKTVFAEHWNRVIASTYPVPEVTEGRI
jgi:hypothetical protein